MKILIIGKGELGTALEFVLKKNPDNEVLLKGRGFQDFVSQREVVFMAVPTKAVREVVRMVNQVKKQPLSLVVLSKGLTEEGKTALEIAQESWSGKIALISGPMLAEELIQGKEAQALVSGDSESVINLFKGTTLSLERTDDLTGLSWTGPLKNIYAIGLGISKGEGRGSNYQGVLVQRAVSEMAQIIVHFGGRKETAYSIAGIGDLIATGFSGYSSNFNLGVNLAKGKKWSQLTEGVMAALGLRKRLSADRVGEYPLLEEIINRLVRV